MFRAPTLLLIAAACICFTVKASPEPISKDFLTSLLTTDENEDDGMSTDEYRPFGELGAVISAIKNQFREILQEILYQMVDYFVGVLRQMKLKLVRKLGTYTLADVLNFACDFITDLLVTPAPTVAYASVRNPMVSPYGDNAAMFTSLHALLNAGDEK